MVDEASGNYPGATRGHMIHIPNFGWISLATVKVSYKEIEEEDRFLRKTTFTLTMIELKLGCAIDGNANIASGGSNGTTYP